MRTTLYLVRHGKTDWNDQGRLQGAKDIPLNKAGLSEAKAAGITLKSVPVHAICDAYPYKVEYIHDKKKYVPTDFPIELH